MLDRYETGPLATVLVFVGALAFAVFGLVNALRFHHADGWLTTVMSLLFAVVFDQRYRRESD